MFTISKRRCNQAGQVLLIVLKDGKEDRGGNAYVQQQVPEDFADYVIYLQSEHEKLKTQVRTLNSLIETEISKARSNAESLERMTKEANLD